jgi:hypothetical protein
MTGYAAMAAIRSVRHTPNAIPVRFFQRAIPQFPKNGQDGLIYSAKVVVPTISRVRSNKVPARAISSSIGENRLGIVTKSATKD